MAHVEKEGAVVEYVTTGKNGELLTREKQNVWLGVAIVAEKTLISCYDRLGFSPLSRDRAKPVVKDETKAPLPVGSIGALLAEIDAKEKIDVN